MPLVMGAQRLEELARRGSDLTLYKNDLAQLSDLASRKLNDLLIIGARNASYNGHDLVVAPDLPLTKGLLQSMDDLSLYLEEIELEPILEQLATYPPLDRQLSEEVVQMLPELVGTIILVTVKFVVTVYPDMSNLDSDTWERVSRAMDLLL